MDNTENREVEGQRPQNFQNNPLVLPSDGPCPIDRLPPEILSLIFEHGTAAYNLEETDEEGPMTWNDFLEHHGEDGREEEPSEQKSQAQEEQGGHETKVINEEGSDSDCGRSGYDSELPSDSEVLSSFQVIVSHVCRHWRTVALETPSLWTTIKVSSGDRPPFERVTAFLERSKSLPLDICIDSVFPDDLSDNEDEPVELLIDDLQVLCTLLIPHVPRWGSLEVRVASYEHMYKFLRAVSDPSVPPASQLRALELYHHDESDNDISTFPEPDFSDHFTLFSGSAPRLRNLTLWGVHVDWTQGWLRSSNLVELELAYHTQDVRPDSSAFSAMLHAAAPTLEKLCLEMSGPSGEWIIEPGAPEWSVDANNPILLPKLIQLELGFSPPSEVIALLRKLCLPSLKALALNFDNGDYTDLVACLVGPSSTTSAVTANSLSKEQPRNLLRGLEALKIAGLPCSEESAGQMYNELVNLESLTLYMHHLPSTFFRNLYPQPSPKLEETGPRDPTVSYRTPLPRLTTLFLSDVSGHAVRRFVHERQWIGMPLRRVFVEEDTYITSEEESWLKENLEKFDYFEGSDDEDDEEYESVSSSYVSSVDEWDADDDSYESDSE
ncbi:hypothetical protein EDC04DRAFT_2582764 [Pisolithus marmoratus]|nr:hypothetical protein EDC04DRAFT_2582764 [Pisolithus marmoratus]